MTWQRTLIQWYRRHRRDLPWRQRPTPYRVWISEIMLQQTTVKAVIPYYRRFVRKFPSLRSLARASRDDVLAAWSGLGYYTRARNLHQTAQICVAQHGGRIPKDPMVLKGLPGIGNYTAGAIASIAYDEAAAIVDGNVARVLSRLFGMTDDPKTGTGMKAFWSRANAVMWPRACGDYNQALMELGAILCTPTQPTCELCPLRTACAAYLRDDPRRFPQIKQRTQYRSVQLTAALIAKNGSYLMVQRPKHGVLREMWEFPMIEGDLAELTQIYGLRLNTTEALPSIRHSIMDQRITVTPWLCTLQGRGPKFQESQWVSLEQLKELPSSSMIPKLAARLAGR